MNQESRRTALYRHFDANGALLYVGISFRFLVRLMEHRANSAWFGRIKAVTVQWYPSREEALAAETLAIHVEIPIFNGPNRHLRLELVRENVERINESAARETEIDLGEAIREAHRHFCVTHP